MTTPEFLPRSAWTAAPPARPLTPVVPKLVKGLGIHWPGSRGSFRGMSQSQVAHYLEQVRLDHVLIHGWSDIAYQAAIDAAGRIWVLRGISKRSAANGNRAVNDAYGAVVLLLGVDEHPTREMLDGFHAFWTRAWLPRYPKAEQRLPHEALHKMVGLPFTDCPGPVLTHLIADGALR